MPWLSKKRRRRERKRNKQSLVFIMKPSAQMVPMSLPACSHAGALPHAVLPNHTAIPLFWHQNQPLSISCSFYVSNLSLLQKPGRTTGDQNQDKSYEDKRRNAGSCHFLTASALSGVFCTSQSSCV